MPGTVLVSGDTTVTRLSPLPVWRLPPVGGEDSTLTSAVDARKDMSTSSGGDAL